MAVPSREPLPSFLELGHLDLVIAIFVKPVEHGSRALMAAVIHVIESFELFKGDFFVFWVVIPC